MVRKQPRISANKLGEYLAIKSPGRRKTIVKQQKEPPQYVVAY